MLLEGLLAATIARIDPPAAGWGHPGVASSRTRRCRSVWLADVQAPGNSLTELRLLDDRVRYCTPEGMWGMGCCTESSCGLVQRF